MRTFLMILLAAGAGCSEHATADEHKTSAWDKSAALSAAAKPEVKARKTEAPAPAVHAPTGPAPLDALTRLSAGNARFATAHRERSATVADDAAERAATVTGQHPFAAILTCADSRVPPELLFDQSLGDLFVVRNAGNVADPIGEGSLEYAVEHLGVRLVVVLGHGSCGAVKAVTGSDTQLPGHLADIQRAMPGLHDFAAERGKAGRTPEDTIADAVEHNAIRQATALISGSEVLRQALGGGRIAVVPAVYDLASGVVGFLPPVQSASAAASKPSTEPAAHVGH